MNNAKAVRVPASSSNLGPGFDALSLALEIYLRVEVETGSSNNGRRVVSSGVDSEKMPEGEDNLIVRVLDRVAGRRNREVAPAVLKVQNEIPLARGLGSSSTAILAGISCYEILAEERLSVEEIFEYAREFEPHPDNLAAGLFGSLTVSATSEKGGAVFSKTLVPDGLTPVLVIPDFELPTEKARGVLPENYTRRDLVFNMQRSALVVAALGGGDWELLSEAMRDRVHQPYRAALIPGLEEVLAMEEEGLRGIALSGSGPTVLAFTMADHATSLGEKIVSVFGLHGVSASFRISKIDTGGRCFIK